MHPVDAIDIIFDSTNGTFFCVGTIFGGPNPNDCNVIQGALLYDSQALGDIFAVRPNASMLTLQYKSCSSFFLNQAKPNQTLEYCRTDFAALTNYIAWNCQATQNAHGGLCVANDQRWFVQYVVPSPSSRRPLLIVSSLCRVNHA